MKLLEGVLFYELVLIFLGILVSMALLFAFLQSVKQNKTSLKPIYAFIVPLMMIGYPSIQKIQFENGVLNIEKTSKEIEKNPLDTLLQKQLLSSLRTFSVESSDRLKESPAALSAVANAQVALGRYDSAQVLIRQAVKLDSTSAPVMANKQKIKKKTESKKQFDLKVKQVDKQLKMLEKQPQSKMVRDSISQALKEVSIEQVSADDASLITIATAAAVSGHQTTAIDLIDKVLKVNPSKDVKVLKEQILSGDILKKYNTYSLPAPSTKTPSIVDKPNATERVTLPTIVSDSGGGFSIKAFPNAVLRFH
jgi:tetratricopeptide (TPR) repeat protein